MSDLIEQINTLSREQVFEAVGFLGEDIGVDAAEMGQKTTTLKPLNEKPFENVDDLEQLARITLVAAAMNPEYEALVKDAIEGAGKKQFVLGGAEIVALSVVALGALHVIITKGKTGEKRTIQIEESDGKVTVKMEEQVNYGISGILASVLKSIM